jgi:hypothetical protein
MLDIEASSHPETAVPHPATARARHIPKELVREITPTLKLLSFIRYAIIRLLLILPIFPKPNFSVMHSNLLALFPVKCTMYHYQILFF